MQHNFIERSSTRFKHIGFWAFFIGLIVSALGTIALLGCGLNCLFGLAITLAFLFACSFTNPIWGGSPFSPRGLVGMWFVGFIVFGTFIPIVNGAKDIQSIIWWH